VICLTICLTDLSVYDTIVLSAVTRAGEEQEQTKLFQLYEGMGFVKISGEGQMKRYNLSDQTIFNMETGGLSRDYIGNISTILKKFCQPYGKTFFPTDQ